MVAEALEVAGLEEEVAAGEEREEPPVVGVEAGALEVTRADEEDGEVALGVVPPALVLLPPGADVADPWPDVPSLMTVFRQPDPPSPTETAADWAMVPVESFKLRMKLVPPGTSTFQVKPSPVRPSNSLRRVPPVVVPSVRVRMYGGCPPVQVKRVG